MKKGLPPQFLKNRKGAKKPDGEINPALEKQARMEAIRKRSSK